MESTSLSEQRKNTAAASLGTSGNDIYKLCLKIIEEINHNGPHGQCLDFGAGTGHLVRALSQQNRFSSVTAIDLMQRPVDLNPAIAWISQDLNLPVPLPDGSSDFLVSTEVLGYLENPRATFREWKRLLRPGGTLLFSIPNNESIRSILSLIFRGHYVAFDDLYGSYQITPLLHRDILRILKETGFSTPSFIYSNHGAIPKCVSLTWQQISCGLLAGKRFSDNVFVVAKK